MGEGGEVFEPEWWRHCKRNRPASASKGVGRTLGTSPSLFSTALCLRPLSPAVLPKADALQG